jgi:hypothetical protein
VGRKLLEERLSSPRLVGLHKNYVRGRPMRKMVMLVSAVVADLELAVAGPATERG